MGTTAEKLAKLAQTKADIKYAIIEKGQSIADTEPFSAYPAKIRAIEGGSGAGFTPMTPEEVYAKTRPADWLPMPTPGEDEIYLLFHIPDGDRPFWPSRLPQ